jgi:hypothetical protein
MGNDERVSEGTPTGPLEGVLVPAVVSRLAAIKDGEEENASSVMETIAALGNTQSGSMAVCLRVELDAITRNRVHDPIKGHECASEKMADVKGDAHTVGRHENRGGGGVWHDGDGGWGNARFAG